jgi:hypothetical protein
MKLYGTWESREKDLPEKFYAFSDAYLDSAERLCKVLKRSTRKATYERGAVVLYLAFHSVELFLKGSILSKCPDEKLSHNLENYFKRYNNLYPGKRFRFDLPFKTEYTGFEPHEVEKIKKELPPQDQIHKYPTDRDGNEWRDPFAFEPISFLKVIEQLKSDFKRIRNEIIIGYRDRDAPHRAPLPHHAAYGSVLRDSADPAESDPGKHKSE